MFASAEEMNKSILDGFRKAKELWDSSQWTDKPPTERGWYWVKESSDNTVIVVRVSEYNGILYVSQNDLYEEMRLSDSGKAYIMWLGPIPEPEMPKG